jgi:Uma2 family endonuclease
MVQAPLTALTLADFLQLAETKPASEYIDGQILQKPMPQGRHSAIQGELVAAINGVVRSPKMGRAFPELRCTFGGRSTVPDIAVFLWDRIPRDSGGAIADAFSVAPDWTIEILSPAQSQTKVTKNILHALQYGTQMGWLIDPEEQTLLIYRPQQQPEVVDVPEGILPVPPFAGALRLTVRDVFAWLLD